MYKIASLVFFATTVVASSLYYYQLSSSSSCCSDSAIVSIPLADFSPPDIYWEATVKTISASGIGYATTKFTNASNTLSIKKTDGLSIKLVARDDESAIRSLSYSGYGVCMRPNPHGLYVLPTYHLGGKMPDFPQLTTCGFVEWQIGQQVTPEFSCDPPPYLDIFGGGSASPPSSRIISVDGTAENHKGGKSKINLSIQISN